MAAGVLRSGADERLIDTAGIETDRTLLAFDYLNGEPLAALKTRRGSTRPVGAARRLRPRRVRPARRLGRADLRVPRGCRPGAADAPRGPSLPPRRRRAWNPRALADAGKRLGREELPDGLLPRLPASKWGVWSPRRAPAIVARECTICADRSCSTATSAVSPGGSRERAREPPPVPTRRPSSTRPRAAAGPDRSAAAPGVGSACEAPGARTRPHDARTGARRPPRRDHLGPAALPRSAAGAAARAGNRAHLPAARARPRSRWAAALGDVRTGIPGALMLPSGPARAWRAWRSLELQRHLTAAAVRETGAELAIVSSPTMLGSLRGARRAGAATLLYSGEVLARGGIRGAGGALIGRAAARNADAVIAASQIVGRPYEGLGLPVTVVHPPIAAPPAAEELRRRGTAWRADHGLDPGATVVATLGAITAGRGQDLLVRALAEAPSSKPWTLVIGGEAYDRPRDRAYAVRLERLIAELGVVGPRPADRRGRRPLGALRRRRRLREPGSGARGVRSRPVRGPGGRVPGRRDPGRGRRGGAARRGDGAARRARLARGARRRRRPAARRRRPGPAACRRGRRRCRAAARPGGGAGLVRGGD